MELLGKEKIEWKGQPDDLMEFLTKMIDDKILLADKRELPGQSNKLISELNIIKPNLRDGYGIKFENSHRSESGLSEITITLDKETFKRAVNYSKDDKDNKNSTSNNRATTNNNNCKSKNRSTGSSSDKGEDKKKTEVVPESNNQHVHEREGSTRDYDNKTNTNDSIMSKYGLGAGAEAWNNESYDDEEDDYGGD
jgi:hypothetical protein